MWNVYMWYFPGDQESWGVSVNHGWRPIITMNKLRTKEKMPPENTFIEGFWGDVTSTLDWCEENYVVSAFLAEFCKFPFIVLIKIFTCWLKRDNKLFKQKAMNLWNLFRGGKLHNIEANYLTAEMNCESVCYLIESKW